MQSIKQLVGRHARRGMTVIEIVAAAAILAVLLASVVQAFRVFDTHRRVAERRAVALETTQSLLEQLSNTPWDGLTPAIAEKLAIPAAVKSFLPGANVAASVADVSEPVVAKRVSVELKWNAPSGAEARPVRLTSWVYPP
jgi:prepilin-type N-terminal cleavage/methylation domain-containing protein